MYRGTTPTFTFTLPIECETITKLSVAFKQGGKLLFERGLPDVTSPAWAFRVPTRLTAWPRPTATA